MSVFKPYDLTAKFKYKRSVTDGIPYGIYCHGFNLTLKQIDFDETNMKSEFCCYYHRIDDECAYCELEGIYLDDMIKECGFRQHNYYYDSLELIEQSKSLFNNCYIINNEKNIKTLIDMHKYIYDKFEESREAFEPDKLKQYVSKTVKENIEFNVKKPNRYMLNHIMSHFINDYAYDIMSEAKDEQRLLEAYKDI